MSNGTTTTIRGGKSGNSSSSRASAAAMAATTHVEEPHHQFFHPKTTNHRQQHQQQKGNSSGSKSASGKTGKNNKNSSRSGSNNNNHSQQKHDNEEQQQNHRIYFLTALANIPVPERLLRGIPVFKVAANGKTTDCLLILSKDKFTLYIAKNNRPGGGGSGGMGSKSPVSPRTRKTLFGLMGASSQSSPSSQPVIEIERSIDIGEMDRVQRGQSTFEFEKAKKTFDRLLPSSSSLGGGSSSGLLLRKPSEMVRAASTGSAMPNSPKRNHHHNSYNNNQETNSSFLSNHSHSSHSSMGGGGSSHNSQQPLSHAILDPLKSFSIIFRGAHTLDLMAESYEARNEICDALDRCLLAYQRGKIRVSPEVLLLRYVWLDVGDQAKKSGYVTCNELGRILQEINFSMRPRELQSNYDKFARILALDRKQRQRGLTFEQSATFLHKLKRDSWMVKPVQVLWNELFGEIMNNGKARTTVSDRTFLEKFVRGKQGQVQTTIVDVRKLFRRLHDMELTHTRKNIDPNENQDLHRINRDQFETYLFAHENDAFDPCKEKFDPQDMNQPLSEYWINSSHNTYLIGDQYTSHSHVEMYSNALYRGARCLELDIWDGTRNAQTGQLVPVVWHGHTMTTKIRFVDIIKTIKVFLNFHPDTYPIVLSFENHCSIPYQQVMAEQLVKILGDSLYVPTEASLFGRLPSPAQLRGMVVIKGRRPTGTEADAYDTDDESDDGVDAASASAVLANEYTLEGSEIAVLNDASTATGASYNATTSLSSRHSPTNTNTPSITTTITTNSTAKSSSNAAAAAASKKICPQLARLTLLHGFKHSSWEQSMRTPTHHMHSFSESKIRAKCRHREAASWIVFNQTHCSRTYPAGARVDSSNYNPVQAWSVGCQMVALNFQTEDAYLRLNDGRFRENGNCGYVLKPSSLMIKDDISISTLGGGGATTGSMTTATTAGTSAAGAAAAAVRLSVRVLQGSCLPKPKGLRSGDCIDPYVKVAVFDCTAGEERETITAYPTGIVQANGFFPIWSQEKFCFTVENWSVAMLQLVVYDKQSKDEIIASSSIPISCLRRGIRSVKLYEECNTRSGAFDFASLLLDIKIGQVVAEI